MIRGVNRQVIEVKNTGSVYFERALLVVNPVFSDVAKTVLTSEAQQVIGELGSPSGSGKQIKRLKRCSILLAATAVGAFVAVIVLLFLQWK